MRHDTAPETSRAATDGLLLELRTRRWRPAAWAGFLADATTRSLEQAALHPRALGEVTALHGLFLFVGGRDAWRWVATSWTLSALHLGMLEDRAHLGAANALTLVRASLPVTGSALGRWLAVSAMASDFVDGRLARRTGTATPFGRYADPLADAAVWTWLTRPDAGRGSRVLQACVVSTWVGPAADVIARSVARGRMVEAPRPRWIRPAAAVQILIAARDLRRRPSPGSPGPRQSSRPSRRAAARVGESGSRGSSVAWNA